MLWPTHCSDSSNGRRNIVDFVQSALENAGTLACIPAERVVRMGEPSALMPISGVRDFYSFYVDNFDSFRVMRAFMRASRRIRHSL